MGLTAGLSFAEHEACECVCAVLGIGRPEWGW